jgi:hypothetical protein
MDKVKKFWKGLDKKVQMGIAAVIVIVILVIIL